MTTRYWIGVVSREHVERGVGGGFAQLCHGKSAPLARMQPGDWLVYYSPRLSLGGAAPCQEFTALGQVLSAPVYSCAVTPTFTAARRDVRFVAAQSAPIRPLLGQLAFITDQQRWGYLFRRGHFAISAADFAVIAGAMGAAVEQEVALG